MVNHAIADLNDLARDVTVTRQSQTSATPSHDSALPLRARADQNAASALTAVGSTIAVAATAHDPAVLDSLARQLYGRFSRHLAGELLIDRERAQFLTDLT